MTKHWRTVNKMKKWGNKGISYRELQSNISFTISEVSLKIQYDNIINYKC